MNRKICDEKFKQKILNFHVNIILNKTFKWKYLNMNLEVVIWKDKKEVGKLPSGIVFFPLSVKEEDFIFNFSFLDAGAFYYLRTKTQMTFKYSVFNCVNQIHIRIDY